MLLFSINSSQVLSLSILFVFNALFWPELQLWNIKKKFTVLFGISKLDRNPKKREDKLKKELNGLPNKSLNGKNERKKKLYVFVVMFNSMKETVYATRIGIILTIDIVKIIIKIAEQLMRW